MTAGNLTQARLKELLHYDPENGVFTHIKARRGLRSGSLAGGIDKAEGYLQIMVDGKRYQAHRLAWLYVHGDFPPNDIDHISRVRDDNRICNLRLATRSENMQNLSLRSTNTSGHTGVVWCKNTEKWRALIMLNGK